MPRQSKNTSGGTSPRHIRAANDAFGKTSPHWNLPFPTGKLTAAEILAYCPHWLKSVDVIDRFVTNGGKAKIIAGMLNRFRTLPSVTIPTNSICVMMQCAMRAAGFTNWTMGDHTQIDDDRNDEWDGADLEISNFRTPRVTHPKKGSKKVDNIAAEPIEFRDLAHNVKEHPSGSDALDLTRCVLYALDHPDESWRFPVDFEHLVNKLGGPQPPTPFHLDSQAFGRRVAELYPSTFHKLSVTPSAKRVRFAMTDTIVSIHNTNMRLNTPKKRGYGEVDSPKPDIADTLNKRRSGRIAKLDVKDFREPDSDTSTPYKNGNGNAYGPPQKKHKSDRASSTESEFFGDYTSGSESLPVAQDDVSDDSLTPVPKRPVRASAQIGRRLTQKAILKETPNTPRSTKGTKAPQPAVDTTLAPKATIPDELIDPVLLGEVHAWEARVPVQVDAPLLDHNRLVIDEHSVWLYAEEGCTTYEQMWASALSSQRFNNGPRKHAPYRELYRLTDPVPWDISDWAENIRWAKEQYRYFGVETWTEYDYHLEQITEWRRKNRWVSEEAISGGGTCHY